MKTFFDLREVLSGEIYSVETVDGKYRSVKLKNKVDNEQSKLETQKEMPSEFGGEKKLKFEQRRQKFEQQPDTTDKPELEREESAEQRRKEENQQGVWLKILTPNQMISRLPISLAQSKAGNNSKKT